MKRLATLLLVVLSSFALASCGDEEAEPRPSGNAGERVETTQGVAGGVATGGGGRLSTVGEGAAEVHVEAAPEGLAYTTQAVVSEAGETLLHFENPQSVPHDVDLEAADGTLIADMETIAEGYADVPIADLAPGDYVFYCSVPGHREAGMEGTLTVE